MAISRAQLLDIVNELAEKYVVFGEEQFFALVAEKMHPTSREDHEAVLDAWHDFYRQGILSWGMNLTSTSNRSSAWAHLTSLGKKTVAERSRDPANPSGYLASIDALVPTGSVARSYIDESLKTYNAGCDKATAVLVGAAAESLTIELRDELVSRMQALGKAPPKGLTAWQMKHVLDALEAELQKGGLPRNLQEHFEAFWAGFASSLRMSRNDAGHPKSVDPVTRETVHSMLLMFPTHAKLTADLRAWVASSYT